MQIESVLFRNLDEKVQIPKSTSFVNFGISELETSALDKASKQSGNSGELLYLHKMVENRNSAYEVRVKDPLTAKRSGRRRKVIRAIQQASEFIPVLLLARNSARLLEARSGIPYIRSKGLCSWI